MTSVSVQDDYAATTSGAGRLTIGATTTGVIDVPNDIDWFKVSLTALGTYRFTLQGAASQGGTLSWPDWTDVHLRLWNPQTQQYVAPSVYGSGDGDPVETYVADASGDYYVEVMGGSRTGSYTLSAVHTEDDDFYGDYARAASVALGKDQSGRLSYVTDVDGFKLPVVKNHLYKLSYTPGADTKGYPTFQVTDAQGSYPYYASSQVNGPTTLSFVAPGTGSVFVSVQGNGGSTGQYSWRAEELADDFASSPSTTGALAPGKTISGKFEASGDADWFAVDLKAGTSYFMQLSGAGQSYSTLQLYATDGFALDGGALSKLDDGAALVWTPSVSGHYFVQANSPIVGPYQLTLQVAPPDDYGQGTAAAATLATGTAKSGHIELPRDADWFRIVVEAGNSYVLHFAPGADLSTYQVDLRDAKGNAVGTGYSTEDNGRDYLLQSSTPAVYYAQVAGAGARGGYTVSLNVVTDSIPADTTTSARIEPGAVFQGTVDFTGDADWFKVDLVAGERYDFLLQGAGSGHGTLPQSGLTLRDHNGNTLGFGSYDRSPTLSYTADVTQSAWLSVSGGSQGNGSYTLRAASTGTPMADIDAPTVSSTQFPSLASSPGQDNLQLWWDEKVKLAGAIDLFDDKGNLLHSYHANDSALSDLPGQALLFEPVQPLARGASFTLTADAGAVTDLAGNPAAAFSYTFSTADANRHRVGSAANDSFEAGTGNDIFEGGAGLDTVVYSSTRSDYDLVNRQGVHWFSQRTGTYSHDELFGIERVVFSDGALAFDVDGAAGQTYRLYQAAFNRTPDGAGLGYWITQRDQGATPDAIADAFMHSAEFASLYGAAPTHAELAAAMYRNVMHREPDAAGLAYWVGVLDQGAGPAAVLLGFSESPENQANVIGQIQNGITYTL